MGRCAIRNLGLAHDLCDLGGEFGFRQFHGAGRARCRGLGGFGGGGFGGGPGGRHFRIAQPVARPVPCCLFVHPEVVTDQFRPSAARSGLMVIPAPGVLACDFHGDAALGPEAQLLRAGQGAVRGAEQFHRKIGDPVVQQFRRTGHGHAGADARLSGRRRFVEVQRMVLHCHWRVAFTVQSRIGMSGRTDCTKLVQAISCSGRVSMISPFRPTTAIIAMLE